MMMLTYTPEEIRHELTDILGTPHFAIRPIGNHELGRHLVYQVLQENREPLVFKLYCKKNRRLREIASLSLLKATDVKCSRIIQAGVFSDGTEWLLSTFISGIILDRVWDQMNHRQELEMFESLGDELGKIHGAKQFDYFGHWTEAGESVYGFQRYYTEFVRSSEYVFRHVLAQNLPDGVLLIRAIGIIRKHYHLIAGLTESRLTHHDYDGRNILVSQGSGGWQIQGVIDFEQSFPGNPEIDLAGIYARYLMGEARREEAFFRGYEKHMKVDAGFSRRLPYYLLCKGVVICSWTYDQAPDYYAEGIQLIRRFHSLVESGR